MTRRDITDPEKHALAVLAGQRMIARGERPLYRLEAHADAGGLSAWQIPGLPGLAITAPHRRELVQTARDAIASTLEVPIDSFDVEVVV